MKETFAIFMTSLPQPTLSSDSYKNNIATSEMYNTSVECGVGSYKVQNYNPKSR